MRFQSQCKHTINRTNPYEIFHMGDTMTEKYGIVCKDTQAEIYFNSESISFDQKTWISRKNIVSINAINDDTNSFKLVLFTKIKCELFKSLSDFRSDGGESLKACSFNSGTPDNLLNAFKNIKIHPMNQANKKTTVLAIICPASGKGTANNLYAQLIRPLLNSTGSIEILEEFFTTHAGHATEYIKSKWGSDYSENAPDLVLTVSGDGIIYEVLNAIKSVATSQLEKVRLLAIPAGSGNSLANTSIYNQNCLENGDGCELICKVPVSSTLQNFIRYMHDKHGNSSIESSLESKFSLMSICDNKHLSFLTLTYGMIADVDRESESYRFLGEERFTVSGVIRSLFLRKYTMVLQKSHENGQNHFGSLIFPKLDNFGTFSRKNQKFKKLSPGPDGGP